MKRFLALWVICCCLSVLAAGSVSQTDDPSGAAASSEEDVLAFVNVNVVPMDEDRILEDQTVVIRGERIAEIGPAENTDVPEGAQEIDGTGRYLMPGFAEMHGHIPDPETEPNFTDNVLTLYVAHGVTTVRGMLGRSGQLALRQRANAGEILSPSLYLAGPPFTGGSVDGPEDAEQMVRQQKDAGWDFLKVLEGMSREEYDAMAETARQLEMPFVGHVPNDVGLTRVLEAGQETIDHLDGYIDYLNGAERSVPDGELSEVVKRTTEAGVCVVPTMALWETLQGAVSLETLQNYPELAYMPSDQVSSWVESHRERRSQVDEARAQQVIDNRMRLLAAFNEGDACILFGTDSPQQFSVPGFSIHREIERMGKVGMSPYEILASGTKAVGAYLSEKDDFGTVAEGQRADLILLTANPLGDASRIDQRVGVMVRGQWLPEEELQQRLQQIRAEYGD